MKYYLIAGEASGDLHASNLMKALKAKDAKAEFRFYGGEKMAAAGGTLVKHYKELAYMGFIPVLLHLPAILRNMRQCKADISQWQPDVVILVDYPGFNLSIAEYVRKHRICKVFYYISPKIWAWKEHRIKNIRRDVDELFSILPFEEKWFAERDYKVHYVGNPCVDAVKDFVSTGTVSSTTGLEPMDRSGKELTDDAFVNDQPNIRPFTHVNSHKKTIAILAGSRRQEIKDNLYIMLESVAATGGDVTPVIAAAPNIEDDYYHRYVPQGMSVDIRHGQTYQVLRDAEAALVTSGTATLETAILNVPQVVCYYIPCGKFVSWLRSKLLKVKYISLVNLIADDEVVPELVADGMTRENVTRHLRSIMPGGDRRQKMLEGYKRVNEILGEPGASERAAEMMVRILLSPAQ